MKEENRSPFRILELNSLPSTNTYLAALAREGEGEGLVVVARSQSEGKGRFSRRFYSPEGSGVYMSLLLRPHFSPEHFPLLTALAGTAAAEAAEELSGKRVGIKWVNDLYLDGKKIAGILAESGTSEKVNDPLQNNVFVVVGIGINLSLPDEIPDELRGVMGALFEKGDGGEEKRHAFLSLFLSRFYGYYKKMPSRDFLEGYRARSILLGKRVRLYNAAFDTAKTGGETVTVLDIDGDGALVVRTENGEKKHISAGEVTLSV